MENLGKRREEKEESPGWLTNTQHPSLPPEGKSRPSGPQTLDVLILKLGKESMSPEKGHSIYYQECFSLSVLKYSWLITQFITLKHAKLHTFISML